MWKVAVLVASTAIGTVGCSAVQEPIIDKTGVDNGHYSRDLAECFNTILFLRWATLWLPAWKEKGTEF
jgi:hypothetical protein